MAKTGVLIELDLLGVGNNIADEAVTQLQRLMRAGVGLVLLSQDDSELVASRLEQIQKIVGLDVPFYGLSPSSPATWHWPKPAQLLRACAEHDLDIFNSWVIGQNHDLFKAAAQAGLLGAVYIGETKPADTCGLQVLNQADSLADAPRVMIPPKGGCWHQHT